MLTAAAASSASAQQARKLAADLDFRVAHDTNITGTSKAQAALRNLKPEDTTYSPNMHFDFETPLSRQLLFVRGDAGYNFHDVNKKLDSEAIAFQGGGRFRAAACSSTLTGSYRRALTQLDDLVLGAPVNNKVSQKGVKLDVSCARPTGLGVFASGSFDWADNSQALLTPTDNRSKSYSAGVTYQRPALGTFTLFGSNARVEYPHRPVLGGGGTDGYEMNSGGLTIDRRLGARIEGTVTVAYTSTSSLLPSSPLRPSIDFNGVTYSADLSYRPSTRLRTQATFERDVRPSFRLGDAYDLGERYALRADYDLGTRITLELAGERRITDSKGTLPVTAISLTNSRVTSILGGMTYRQSRRLSIRLDYEHRERESNSAIYNYTDDRVGLSTDLRY